MILSGDPYILLSVINTKLRDFYSSLEELCDEEDLSLSEICDRLSAFGYEYDADENAFKPVSAQP